MNNQISPYIIDNNHPLLNSPSNGVCLINNLPNEILTLFFKEALTSHPFVFPDNLRLVNKSWKFVVDDLVLVKLVAKKYLGMEVASINYTWSEIKIYTNNLYTNYCKEIDQLLEKNYPLIKSDPTYIHCVADRVFSAYLKSQENVPLLEDLFQQDLEQVNPKEKSEGSLASSKKRKSEFDSIPVNSKKRKLAQRAVVKANLCLEEANSPLEKYCIIQKLHINRQGNTSFFSLAKNSYWRVWLEWLNAMPIKNFELHKEEIELVIRRKKRDVFLELIKMGMPLNSPQVPIFSEICSNHAVQLATDMIENRMNVNCPVYSDEIAKGVKERDLPIHYACKYNDLKIFRLLVDARAYIREYPLPSGNEPLFFLHYACKIGSLSIVKELVEIHKFNVNEKDNLGRTPLQCALKKIDQYFGFVDIIIYLLRKGAQFHFTDAEGNNVLHMLFAKKLLNSFQENRNFNKIFQTFIGRVACIHGINNEGSTPLHLAIQNGYFDQAMKLIEMMGAKANTRDQLGCTPIFYLKDYMFYDQEHDLETKNIAIFKEMCQLFVANGGDLNHCGHNLSGLLHEACKSTNFSQASALIEMPHISISAQDSEGNTPIHYAAWTYLKKFSLYENMKDQDHLMEIKEVLNQVQEILYRIKTLHLTGFYIVNKQGDTPISILGKSPLLLKNLNLS